MLTVTSSQAQNAFSQLIDHSQREAVSITRRNKIVSLVMSPDVLEEYIDARLALEAKNKGLLTSSETESVLDKFR
ncbi:type II toxin-antitoxin system Phd/YefM family antitoxin [Lonepinella sp. BR2357]|uniref:type II toxin-antitoxin system Phd/YefM family antitoxin n=1 Tax=Lonepinella sp. BR2357 TaxID=3434549 RepID=UPI003F6DB11A